MMGVLSSILTWLAKTGHFPSDQNDMQVGEVLWWAYLGVSAGLVLFGGIMSGLTLGLMSLGPVELEILRRSGTQKQQKEAATILPVIKNQHQLLVTLLLCNAAAMEALPVFLDKIFHPLAAVILSVTVVLTFGEVIPQAICSRYGLSVGANLLWLVRIAMFMCYPVAFPVGKILDALLGHNNSAIFRRAQLKALVSIHGKEEGKGGELSHDETTIISGALDMTEKMAEAAMTPIESTFSLDVNAKLNWETLGKILARGHSRIPVYSGNPRNIIGLLLVKSLLTVLPEEETPVSAVSIRRMPRVPANMPLYDILNEFQKGSSHMAAVVRSKVKSGYSLVTKRASCAPEDTSHNNFHGSNDKIDHNQNKAIDNKKPTSGDFGKDQMDKTLLQHEPANLQRSHGNDQDSGATISGEQGNTNEDEVIGIITLEDVFEELLQVCYLTFSSAFLLKYGYP
ncbi:hypothetical protein O6H91_16G010800 [Diphasiastrum complanatum]|uniref:Uncharacterized protein n=1 Tax=Diphasiastrum complanatum TaxID=34168 RepID=A0ACC2B9W7_DIPCM|nr:hypothetical protein O6H91_16G010800 [Diphasiastrum complanatum]